MDRQDAAAAGWDPEEQLSKYDSQTNYKQGFGRKFGIQKDRQNKPTSGYDVYNNLEKREKQIGYGGKFGVENNNQGRSGAGFDYNEKLA
ncbi:unnamed protein product [Angiostrongylus costaricensis]|uniref:G-patch domain-containing protein n=1 Tax=Angiostrongylus costaricensis TaxID=334426 RepID=A0A0R3PSJ2_ANGCS|nr:unnamed protein product [Angiostrongylus costaricensis]